MVDHDFCDTKLSLRIGLDISVPESDHENSKRVPSFDLSFGVEQGQDSSENVGEIRKKSRLSEEQTSILESIFQENPNPDTAHKNELAVMLSLNPRQIDIWFQNRLARNKSEKTVTGCEQWKQQCQDLTEENNKLKEEIQQMKAVEVSEKATFSAYLTNSMAVSICPKCKKVEEVSGDAAADVVRIPKSSRAVF